MGNGMEVQLKRSKRHLPGTSSLPAPDVALVNEVRNWDDLMPGDLVQILTETGTSNRAIVDTINDDGSIIWLRNEPVGDRSLHLKADPVRLYRR